MYIYIYFFLEYGNLEAPTETIDHPAHLRFLSNVTTHFFLEHRELRKAGKPGKPSTVVHPREQLDNRLYVIEAQLESAVNHLYALLDSAMYFQVEKNRYRSGRTFAFQMIPDAKRIL